MEMKIANRTSRTGLHLLAMGALVAAGVASTHSAKAEAPCIDDVVSGVCVPVNSPEPANTEAVTSSKAKTVASASNANCDQLAGICEPAPTQIVAASEFVRTGAPLYASRCDQMAGVCDGVDGSSTQVADTNGRGIRNRIEARKARTGSTAAHADPGTME